MSGRSGYVRAEQATRSRSNYRKSPQNSKTQADTTTSQTTLLKLFCPSENRSIDILNTDCQDLNFISTTTNVGSYTLTCPENLPSQLQKSPFRAKIDEKSVKCINEIRRAFRMEKEKKLQSKSSASYIGHIDLKKNSQLYESSNSVNNHTCNHTHTYCQNFQLEKKASHIPFRHVQLRRWFGTGKNVEPWAKLRKDPELFDSFGDTLVFFCDIKMNIPYPGPSLRISSHFIEATGSRILINILRESCIIDGLCSSRKKNELSRKIHNSQDCHFDGQISYEIFFPLPYGLSETEAQNYQVTTRNVFALLLNSSLVGQTIYEALYDLRNRMEEYMPEDADVTRMIINWIKKRGIDDPRHSLSSAFSLLAWSEDDNVRWEEGWSEAFCHAVGMRALKPDQKLESIPEFRYLSPITKTLLSRFSVDTQLLVKGCQYRLCNFDFTDMWDVANQKSSTGRLAFDRLRKFLVQHYHKVFGSWPPDITDGKEHWLTRTVARKLSYDFGALYDYLVNRSIFWDFDEEHAGRKWNMKCASNQTFDPDTMQLPISDMIISFDDRMGYPHIPYPYCLTPEPVLAQSNLKPSKKVRKNTRQQEELMQERQAEMAYQDSTNIYILGSDFVSNDLVDSYTNFEKEERSKDMDLYNCRRGRWVLIYGILQVLASISVDTPQLRYIEDVDYHLQSPLRGTPPWRGADKGRPEADHTGSHCWLIPNKWSTLQVNETESRSGSSSHTYNTRVTSNINSARDNINRLSSTSYESSNINFSLESTTLNNLNISPDRVSRKLCSLCSLASCRETLDQEWNCNSGINNSRKIQSTCQSIDSLTSSMDSLVVSPLPLRSSHLRRVKNSIKLSSGEVCRIHSDNQNLIKTPTEFQDFSPPMIDKELAR
ncbi:hypothetical protein EPUL_005103 [Erysiphe pulchra]|uniref:DUF8004 domain-containing protein n=1 Tax=Erysiphe pulchra TaxID=225359 RepID=A0A2S4PSB1_9PEZI|nr:hypothetical protein EPUL_005103 [Erysiphe pulchra]